MLFSYCCNRIVSSNPNKIYLNQQVENAIEFSFLCVWCALTCIVIRFFNPNGLRINMAMFLLVLSIFFYYFLVSKTKIFTVEYEYEELYQSLSKSKRILYTLLGILYPLAFILLFFVIAVFSISGISA